VRQEAPVEVQYAQELPELPDVLGRWASLQVRYSILQWLGTFAADCVTEKGYLGDAKNAFCGIDEDPAGLELLEECS
jgi:hypothetical protein